MVALNQERGKSLPLPSGPRLTVCALPFSNIQVGGGEASLSLHCLLEQPRWVNGIQVSRNQLTKDLEQHFLESTSVSIRDGNEGLTFRKAVLGGKGQGLGSECDESIPGLTLGGGRGHVDSGERGAQAPAMF